MSKKSFDPFDCQICPEDLLDQPTVGELRRKARKALDFPRNVEPGLVQITRDLQNELPLHLQNELDEEDDIIY